MVILSITPWLPTYMGQSLIRCNTVDLTVRAQLAGPIVVPIPGFSLEVGSNNPNKVRVTIPGPLVMVKIIVNDLVPCYT